MSFFGSAAVVAHSGTAIALASSGPNGIVNLIAACTARRVALRDNRQYTHLMTFLRSAAQSDRLACCAKQNSLTAWVRLLF